MRCHAPPPLQACTSYNTNKDVDELDGIKASADVDNYLRGCVWLLDMYINGASVCVYVCVCACAHWWR